MAKFDSFLHFKHDSALKNFLAKWPKILFSSWADRFFLAAILLANGLGWLSAWQINSQETTSMTILGYNVDFGNSMVGNPSFAYLLPLAGLAIIIANSVMVVLSEKLDRLVFFLFLGAALAANLIIVVGLLFIKFINFH